MKQRGKKPEAMGEMLSRLMAEEGVRERMLLGVLEKAEKGDMKAMEFVRDLLGETWKEDRQTVTIKLGKGVEELCK